MKKGRRMGFERRQTVYGYAFVLPWVIGILQFFLIPFVRTVFYSFNTLTIDRQQGFVTTFDGLRHYRAMLTTNTDFWESLGAAFGDLLYAVPLTICFSVFVAVLLNKKFFGRTFFRAVFFLPVIVTSGVVMSLLQSDTNASSMINETLGESNEALLQITVINDLLSGFGFEFANTISKIVSQVINVGWNSGVQILLILAGLQNIPGQLYEVERMEGATKWEEFWKVTFPLCMPVVFIAIIYSIIDSFTAFDNPVIEAITARAFGNSEYSYAGAMALVYSLLVLVLIGAVYLVIGRRVTYTEK